MPEYNTKSMEELRWEDYSSGCKGNTGGAAHWGFGSVANNAFGAASAGSPFGGTVSTSAFGRASASAFGGASPTPAFGGGGGMFGGRAGTQIIPYQPVNDQVHRSRSSRCLLAESNEIVLLALIAYVPLKTSPRAYTSNCSLA